MTKSELIDAFAGRSALTKTHAEILVNYVFDAMFEALRRGERVEIRGFGSFTRPAPQTARRAQPAHRPAHPRPGQAPTLLQGRDGAEGARERQPLLCDLGWRRRGERRLSPATEGC